MADAPVEMPKPGKWVELDDDTRQSLSTFRGFLETMAERAVIETSEASRWLLASLLTVNAGALIAAIGSSKINAEALRIAGPCWLVGVILALVVGLLNVTTGTASMKVMGDYIGKITAATSTGWIKMPDWEGDSAKLQRMKKWPWIVGTLSAIAFIGGAVAMSPHLINPAPIPPAPGTHTKADAPVDRSPAAAPAPSAR